MSTSIGDVTGILNQARQGDADARNRLYQLVYAELGRIARIRLRGEFPTPPMSPNSLVHEAYLKLIDITRVEYQDRTHFFSVASNVMRRILVDQARANHAQKRGGGDETLVVDEELVAIVEHAPEILAVNEALDRLAAMDERQALIVEMRFFAGMTEEEASVALGVSVRTVKRDWAVAKAWLYQQLHQSSSPSHAQT